MTESDKRRAFNKQRQNAKRRAVEWQLTFEQWVEWWGEDIIRRGSQRGDLCMMRKGDAGPYALGNIEKGDGYANARTAGNLKRNRNSERAKAALESRWNAMLYAPDREPPDECPDGSGIFVRKDQRPRRPSFIQQQDV